MQAIERQVELGVAVREGPVRIAVQKVRDRQRTLRDAQLVHIHPARIGAATDHQPDRAPPSAASAVCYAKERNNVAPIVENAIDVNILSFRTEEYEITADLHKTIDIQCQG